MWVEMTTGEELLGALRATAALWAARERTWARFVSWPFIGRFATRQWQRAWREVEQYAATPDAIRQGGLSAMGISIIALGIDTPTLGAAHRSEAP